MVAQEEKEMMRFVREKPDNVELSDYLCEKAEGYVIFMLSGKEYCVPVTPEFKKAFGISRQGDHLVYKQGTSLKVEKVIRDIGDALYLQMRDTVGREIKGDLSRQLTNFLEKKCYPAISGAVDSKLNERLLPEGEPT